MARDRNQRSRFFLDREVQGALVIRHVWHWFALLVAMIVLAVLTQVLTGGVWAPFSEHLSVMWHRYSPVVVVFACLLPIIIWDTIRLSHRFAGPVLRLRSSLKRLAAGEPVEPLQFREGDFWQGLADDFNRVRQLVAQSQPSAARRDEPAEAREEVPCS